MESIDDNLEKVTLEPDPDGSAPKLMFLRLHLPLAPTSIHRELCPVKHLLVITWVALLPAAGETVLIDYDDGIPDNGIHEASVRNGGFEDADGIDFATTPFWDSYFAEGAAEDPIPPTPPASPNSSPFTILGRGHCEMCHLPPAD